MRASSGLKRQGLSGLLGDITRETFPKLPLSLGVHPASPIKLVMKTTTAGGQPDLVQGFLQVDDDLTAVSKGQRDHATGTLVVDVSIGVIVQVIAADLHAHEQAFSLVQKFKVGHYNRCMLKVLKILVTAHALVGGAAILTACGQKGPLVLPGTPESAGRATLTQTLTPWRAQNAAETPLSPARAITETNAPATAPPDAPTTAPSNTPAAPTATPR